MTAASRELMYEDDRLARKRQNARKTSDGQSIHPERLLRHKLEVVNYGLLRAILQYEK